MSPHTRRILLILAILASASLLNLSFSSSSVHSRSDNFAVTSSSVASASSPTSSPPTSIQVVAPCGDEVADNYQPYVNKSVRLGGDYTTDPKLCFMTRVHNYRRRIPEWIEYHLFAGVTEFLIVDDCSDPSEQEFLGMQSYIEKGQVTFVNSTTLYGRNCSDPNERPNEGQILPRLAMMAKCKSACDWLGLLDVDEYVASLSKEDQPPQKGFLLRHVKRNKRSYIKLPWKMVGPNTFTGNGEIGKPLWSIDHKKQSRLEVLTCGKWWFSHIKSIISFECMNSWSFSHHPHYTVHTEKCRKAHYQQLHYGMLMNISVEASVAENGCTIPNDGLYAIHLYTGTGEDLLRYRLSRKCVSDGAACRKTTPSQQELMNEALPTLLHWSNEATCNSTCSRMGNDWLGQYMKDLREHLEKKYSKSYLCAIFSGEHC
mmetsp:Transcript_8905/g.14147  ORF Transcript_8905/g.14147 Transcript_8905/m.14147 type:complete len:429 (-) Transcript_8905:9-1295(-)